MRDRMTNLWYFKRPDIAAYYLDLLTKSHNNKIVIVGARRTGKTSLIVNEIIPLAEDNGMFTVYSDCWLDKADPLGSLNHALVRVISKIEHPNSKVIRRLNTEVKKIGAAGFSIEFGDEAKTALPSSPYFLFDTLLEALIGLTKRPILFVIDEFQTVGEHKEGDRIAGALRTAFTRHGSSMRIIFTGSSDVALNRLFAHSKASLYQFASRIPYKPLDTEFIKYIGERFKQATKRQLNEKRAAEIFNLLGHQPEAFLAVVQTPLAREDRTLDDGLEGLLSPDMDTPWTQYWNESSELQRAVLLACREHLKLTSVEGVKRISAMLQRKKISPTSVQRAIETLQIRGLIERTTLITTQALFDLSDTVFELWLDRNGRKLLFNNEMINDLKLPLAD